MEPIKGSNKGSFDRHMQAVRLMRFRSIARTIPQSLTNRQRLAYRAYAARAVDHCGKRQLARVVWPWQARPLDPKLNPAARVKRGRASNPTALA